jgi:hypothetical protein
MRLMKLARRTTYWTLLCIWLALAASFVLTNWWWLSIGSKGTGVIFEYHTVWLAADPNHGPEWLVTKLDRNGAGWADFGWWPQYKTPPWGGFSLILPLWIPIAVLGVAVGGWTFAALRARRHRKGFCPKCHYDRRGLPAGAKCPECGSELSPTPPEAGRRPCPEGPPDAPVAR